MCFLGLRDVDLESDFSICLIVLATKSYPRLLVEIPDRRQNPIPFNKSYLPTQFHGQRQLHFRGVQHINWIFLSIQEIYE